MKKKIPLDSLINASDKVIHKEPSEIRKVFRKKTMDTAKAIHERAKQAWIDLYDSQEDSEPELAKTINEHFDELIEEPYEQRISKRIPDSEIHWSCKVSEKVCDEIMDEIKEIETEKNLNGEIVYALLNLIECDYCPLSDTCGHKRDQELCFETWEKHLNNIKRKVLHGTNKKR